MMNFDWNNQLHRAAIHEAGHVICYYILGKIDNVNYVDIYTGKETGNGYCDRKEECLCSYDILFSKPEGYKYWMDEFRIKVAGVCAEKILFGENEVDKRLLDGEIDPFIKRDEKLLVACGISFQDDSGKKIIDELVKKALIDVSMLFEKESNRTLIMFFAYNLLMAEEQLIDGILTKRIEEKVINEIIRKFQ